MTNNEFRKQFISAAPDVPEHFHLRVEKTLEDMCADTYRFQRNNPKGYRG